MNDRKLVTIGIIIKTYGFEGAVTVKVTAETTTEPKINEPVFIVIDGIPVPFFIRDCYYPGGDTMTMAFDDYFTAESVLMFKGCEVKYESLQSIERLVSFEGYTLSDINSDFSAVIISIDEQPGQLLATVMSGNRELLIPIHPDLIVSVNHKKKTLKMSLPDGLADINI